MFPKHVTEVSMKMIKIVVSSFVLLTSVQIFSDSFNQDPNKMDFDRLLAKLNRTDQDYSDKFFTKVSSVENQNKDNLNSNEKNSNPIAQGNDNPNQLNQPISQGTQQQMTQGYNNQNYIQDPRGVNANKQIEAGDWAEQMRVKQTENYPSNSQNYQTYPTNPQSYQTSPQSYPTNPQSHQTSPQSYQTYPQSYSRPQGDTNQIYQHQSYMNQSQQNTAPNNYWGY